MNNFVKLLSRNLYLKLLFLKKKIFTSRRARESRFEIIVPKTKEKNGIIYEKMTEFTVKDDQIPEKLLRIFFHASFFLNSFKKLSTSEHIIFSSLPS